MRKASITAALAAAVAITALMVPILIGRDGSPKTRAATISTFTDKRDWQVYRIVQVGGQVWMAENLNFAAEGITKTAPTVARSTGAFMTGKRR